MVKIPITIEKTLNDYLRELAQVYRLDRVILFGSTAQGISEENSDIDLAIFSADATDENRLEIMADCWLRTMPYQLDIQPVIYPLSDYDGDNDFIQKEIIARGLEIPVPEQN